MDDASAQCVAATAITTATVTALGESGHSVRVVRR